MPKLADPVRAQAMRFVSCGRRLAHVERRIAALDAHCAQRFAALMARLAELPAAARFHPFDAEPVAARPAAAHESGLAPERRHRAAAPSAAAGSRAQTPSAAEPSGAPRRAGPGAAWAGPGASMSHAAAAAGSPRSPKTAPGAAAPPDRALPSGTAEFGTAVARALRELQLPAPAAPGGLPGADSLGAALGAALAGLARRSQPAAPTRQQSASTVTRRHAPAPQPSADAPRMIAAGVAHALRDALAPIASHTQSPVARGLAPLAATEILQRQLAIQGLAAAAAAGLAAAPLAGGVDPALSQEGATPRTQPADPAPRAASRLLAPGRPADAPGRRSASAPAVQATKESDPATEDLVAELNRLLIDQAWLRGVDLR